MYQRRDNDTLSAAFPEPDPLWPQQLITLGEAWSQDGSDAQRDAILGEMWTLIIAALLSFLRHHAHRYKYGDVDDLRDIASQKALDLFRKLDHRQWNPADSGPGRLCSFLSTLARNGLIDHIRVVGSKQPRTAEIAALEPVVTEEADALADRALIVGAVEGCLNQFTTRVRAVWFLRVLLDMPSRQIGAHPAVQMKVGAVDMALARSRAAMKECLAKKGIESSDLRSGIFADLWEACQEELEGLREGARNQS